MKVNVAGYQMRKILLLLITLLILEKASLKAQQNQKNRGLIRSTPEEQGISSEGIIQFLDAIKESKHEFHGFMFLRHGKVVAEGWWKPYRSDLKHTLYSTTKSFTSSAIGFAVSEGRLKVTDKVISFFPKELPDTISNNLTQLTIRDLLTMSAGWEPEPNVADKDEWIKPALGSYFKYKPGTKFYYNNTGPFLLSAIIQKVTGQKLIDYLTPRLFKPLDISGMDWETNPEGINQGGWGLRLKTEDLAKFGQLYLQKGNWNGKQVLPKTWIEESTTIKIDQPPHWMEPEDTKNSSDYMQGYCYFFWRCLNNAYRADGAMGQYIIVLPDKDAVIAITSESPDMQGQLNLIWKYLLPSIKDKKLPADNEKASLLKKNLSSLTLAVPAKTSASPVEKIINGKIFSIEKNEMQIQETSFLFNKGTCNLTLKYDTTILHLNFGSGKWVFSETTMHHPYLCAGLKGNLADLPAFKVEGAYRWEDENTLNLTLRFIESPHTQKITFHFNHKDVLIDFVSVFTKKLALKGVMKE